MLNFWSILSNTIIKIRGPIMSVIDLHISGVKAESFESWYSWFLPFLPRWFTIPTRIFFQIHYSRRLLITYWLNDFLSGNLVSFRIVSSAFKLLLHPDSVSDSEKQADYQPRLHELYRGVRRHTPQEKRWKTGLSETPSCIPWIEPN